MNTIEKTMPTDTVTQVSMAEIKIRCTMERTFDGKSNLLDFKWIPTDVRP